ncbi:phage holin family protein [Patescibacteria group bacterium]|nr:phage holin family protein [Patescibacteria group bacterium]
MRFLTKLIIQVIANAIGIFIAVYFIQNVSFLGDLTDYLIIGAILTLANLIIRPFLRLISTPLIFITLGLFLIVINGIILFGVDFFIDNLTIIGFWAYLWTTLIISIINAIIVPIAKKKK